MNNVNYFCFFVLLKNCDKTKNDDHEIQYLVDKTATEMVSIKNSLHV